LRRLVRGACRRAFGLRRFTAAFRRLPPNPAAICLAERFLRLAIVFLLLAGFAILVSITE
jgi:hypothetical protein